MSKFFEKVSQLLMVFLSVFKSRSSLNEVFRDPDDDVPEKPPSIYDDHDVIVDRIIHAMAVNNHRASDISRLEVLCNNIDDYCQLLRDTRDALRCEIVFPKNDLAVRLVKVCNFYRGSDDVLRNIVISRGILLNLMLEVVTEHKKALGVKNPSSQLLHAVVRSTTVMVNIDVLSNRLVEPSFGE